MLQLSLSPLENLKPMLDER